MCLNLIIAPIPGLNRCLAADAFQNNVLKSVLKIYLHRFNEPILDFFLTNVNGGKRSPETSVPCQDIPAFLTATQPDSSYIGKFLPTEKNDSPHLQPVLGNAGTPRSFTAHSTTKDQKPQPKQHLLF